MSEDYQVLTYRVQRNEGREKLQRVVIDADAHRVDLRGELRLTEEVVAVDTKQMKPYKVSISPAPLDAETMPVVVGVLPESHVAVEELSNTELAAMLDLAPPTATLSLYSKPTRISTDARGKVDSGDVLLLTDEVGHTLDGPLSYESLMAAAQTLRAEEPHALSTHEELELVHNVEDAEERHEARLEELSWLEEMPKGTAHVHRPSWEELNLCEEQPPQRPQWDQNIISVMLLVIAVIASILVMVAV